MGAKIPFENNALELYQIEISIVTTCVALVGLSVEKVVIGLTNPA